MLALFLIVFGITQILFLIIASMSLADIKEFFLICIMGPAPQITIGIILWLLAEKIAGLMTNGLPQEKLSFDIKREDSYAIAILLTGLFTSIKAIVILLPHAPRIPRLSTPFLNPHNINFLSGWGMLLVGIILTLRAKSLGRFIANFGRKAEDQTREI